MIIYLFIFVGIPTFLTFMYQWPSIRKSRRLLFLDPSVRIQRRSWRIVDRSKRGKRSAIEEWRAAERMMQRYHRDDSGRPTVSGRFWDCAWYHYRRAFELRGNPGTLKQWVDTIHFGHPRDIDCHATPWETREFKEERLRAALTDGLKFRELMA